MSVITETMSSIWANSGFSGLFADPRQLIMIIAACVLLYLGIVKKIGRAHV